MGRQNARQTLVVMARKDVRLTDGNVHRFDVEDHALDVVGFRQFVVVVPRLAERRVVKDGLDVHAIDTREELVAGDHCRSGFLGVNVGTGVGVDSVLNERVLLQGDVVESDALEAVVDAVASVVVRLEVKVNVDRGTLKRHALCSPLAGIR